MLTIWLDSFSFFATRLVFTFIGVLCAGATDLGRASYGMIPSGEIS